MNEEWKTNWSNFLSWEWSVETRDYRVEMGILDEIIVIQIDFFVILWKLLETVFVW